MPSWSAGSARGGGDLRRLLIAGRAERYPAGLALLADGDGQPQDTVAKVGRHPAGVEVVTQEQLAGELTVGALIDDHFVAVLASRRAAGPDGDDIALDGQLDVVLEHPRQIEIDDE